MSKSTQNKISKSDMIDAITLHFSKQGKKMSNLSKVTIPKLNGIITQYQINLEEMMIEINLQKEERKNQDEEDEKQRQKVAQEYKKHQQIMIYMYNKLKPKYKEMVKQAQYDKFVEDAILNNKEVILSTDKMVEMFKKKTSTTIMSLRGDYLIVRLKLGTCVFCSS